MGESLVDFLRSTAVRAPAAEALVDGERRIAYAALWQGTTRVAGFFLRQGLRPGERVALLMDNSIEYVMAYYGVLAAGGVAVALNSAARERDLSNWVAHAGASWLIGDSRHPEWSALIRSCGSQVRAVQVNGTMADRSAQHADWRTVEATPPAEPVSITADAPAAIIYTSGTTGHPKGVVLSHRNLATNVRSILQYLALSAEDRIVNVLPFYYSYGNSVLHTHVAAGACVVLENSLAYPHRTVERIVAERATGFSGVPSTYSLLMNRVALEEYDLSCLRYMTQAGGAMAAASITRLVQQVPHARFIVMYGQTEATARLSYVPPEMLQRKPGSAGVAIPGVVLEIRDGNGHVLPRGQAGEIWARGDNVMLGYWNDREATAAVLRDGWLRTGDLAVMDEDGYLFIEGRRSDMIKSGAHRINPRDIEEVIAEIHGVAEVAVVGVDDEILGQTIKAVVALGPGGSPDAMAIKAHCRARLAIYKVPKLVEFVNELPKTASGKVKRFELIADKFNLVSR